MFAGLFAKLALGALWGKAKVGVVHGWQSIPPKARLWVIGSVVVILLGLAHHWYARHQLKAHYKAGYTQAVADDAKKLKAANARIEALGAAIASDERKKNDAQVATIDAHADAVRLRGPGKAVCPAIPAASSRPQPGPRPVDAQLDRLPDPAGQQLIAVPFDDSTVFAKQSDINAAEVRSWHSWYNRMVAAQAKQ